MTQIINLRRARKQKKRTEKDKQAAANRAKFGRGKAERQGGRAEETRADRAFEGHRLDED